MKTKKKTTAKVDLDEVIQGGKAQVEQKSKRVGRPKSEIKKERVHFYLPVNIIKAIDQNSMGNKSVFAEYVFKFYFDKNNIKY